MKRVYEFVAYTADRIIASDRVLADCEKSARDCVLAELLANKDVQSPRGPFDNDLPLIADVTIEIRPWVRSEPVEPIAKLIREKPTDLVRLPESTLLRAGRGAGQSSGAHDLLQRRPGVSAVAPTSLALGIAARVWCDAATKDRVMDEALAVAFAARIQGLVDHLDIAWGVIANAYSGDWENAPEVWRTAAERFRDRYHEVMGIARTGDDSKLYANSTAPVEDVT